MAVKRPAKLSQTFVKNVAQPGRYGDGRGGFGLSLLVKRTKNGRWSKSWSQRLRINGDTVTRGLGSFPVVALADAREKALENTRRVAQGEDIRRSKPTVPNVREAFDKVIDMRSPSWKNARTLDGWHRSQRYYEPIGSTPVSDVTRSDVINLLAPLWHEKNRTAREMRSNLSTVMEWAIDEGYRGDNPAGAQITRHFGEAPRTVHHPSLDYVDLGAALATVRDADAWWAVKLCLIFTALTCVRSGEGRKATWDEIDLDKTTWTIPAARMKNKEKHKVPLSDQAIEVLVYARNQTGGQGTIFPPIRGGECMSSGTLSRLFRKLEITAAPHGLRASFKNWASAQPHIAKAVAEKALSHRPTDQVVEAYETSDFFKERVPVMQEWADFLTETMGPVVSDTPDRQ